MAVRPADGSSAAFCQDDRLNILSLLGSNARASGLDWMAPVDRSGPQGDYDYYVLALGDTGLAKAQHLQKLYESYRSETILAVR